MAVECFAQGSRALVDDAELTYRAWPFDVTKIERPVHMWQGTDDHLVPFPINKEVAERMPGALWHPVEGEDHLMTVNCQVIWPLLSTLNGRSFERVYAEPLAVDASMQVGARCCAERVGSTAI